MNTSMKTNDVIGEHQTTAVLPASCTAVVRLANASVNPSQAQE